MIHQASWLAQDGFDRRDGVWNWDALGGIIAQRSRTAARRRSDWWNLRRDGLRWEMRVVHNLFVVVYYMGGLMVSAEDSQMSNGVAIGLSLGLLAAGWVAYDLLWRKIAKNEDLSG